MAKTFLDKNNKKLFEVYETKEIVANPVLSGGEASLTSFQVGETKYKIDGGGGGGTEYTAGYGIDITNDVISIEPSEVIQKITVTDIKLLNDEDCFALVPGDVVLEEETITSQNPVQAKQHTPYTVSYKFTGSGSESYTFAELALTNAEAQQIKTVIYNFDGTQSVGSQWSYIETIITTFNTSDITSLTNDQCDSLKIGDKVLEQTTTGNDVANTLYSVSNYTEDENLNLKTLELVSVNKAQISTVTYQKNITPSRGINDWVYIDTQIFSVSANPVSTTETLNSIEINGTNYAIAGGGGSGMDITAQEIEEYFDEYCDIQAEVTEETIEGEDVNVLNLENVELENEAEYLGLDLNASNVSAANKILDIE